MIPRLRPTLGLNEVLAALAWWKEGVESFEESFARRTGARYAVCFAYGRSGLLAILRALKIEKKEIILPAYTCVAVAHAVVKSGNKPVFVDAASAGFNMDWDQAASLVSPATGAVIATNLYGYPLDPAPTRALMELGIPVIQDCALALGSCWNGTPVALSGNAAFYSLNAGKQICALYGGVVTTEDEALYRSLLAVRAETQTRLPWGSSAVRFAHLMAQLAAFTESGYEVTDRLARHTKLLDRWIRYYDPETIEMPANVHQPFAPLQGRVGLAQLRKLESDKESRWAIAQRYDEALQDLAGVALPPFSDGASYSHYTVRVRNRAEFIRRMRTCGIDVGQLFDYVIPELPSYRNGKAASFPRARKLAEEVVNLPNYPALSKNAQQRVIEAVKNA